MEADCSCEAECPSGEGEKPTTVSKATAARFNLFIGLIHEEGFASVAEAAEAPAALAATLCPHANSAS